MYISGQRYSWMRGTGGHTATLTGIHSHAVITYNTCVHIETSFYPQQYADIRYTCTCITAAVEQHNEHIKTVSATPPQSVSVTPSKALKGFQSRHQKPSKAFSQSRHQMFSVSLSKQYCTLVPIGYMMKRCRNTYF